jgi:sec-independent protein translocase protein TatB
MFDIGWSEMAVIMLVALVVIGPKDLPRLARNLGQWVAKGRAMAREFQRSLEDMAREAELDDVKREIEKVGRTNIKKSIEKTIDPTGDLGRAFDPNAKPLAASAAAPNGEAKEPPAKTPQITSEQPAQTAPAQTAPAQTAPAQTAPAKTAPAKTANADSASASSRPRAAAKPKAEPKSSTEAKPKTAAKPRPEAKAKAAAKPGPGARPKATNGNAPNTAAPETGKVETMAEPH